MTWSKSSSLEQTLTLRPPQLRRPVARRTHRYRRTVALSQGVRLCVHIHSQTKIREFGKMGEGEEDVSGLDVLMEVLSLVQVVEALLKEERKEGGEVRRFLERGGHLRPLSRFSIF